MNLEDYPKKDGKKVWLSETEVQQLLDTLDDTIQESAVKLGVRCGLRTHEIVRVAPQQFTSSLAGRCGAMVSLLMSPASPSVVSSLSI